MTNKNLSRNKISNYTQDHLNISEIKDGIVVMRDGTLRAVLLVSSVNFALKSEEEQSAMIGAYANFLNNIDFVLQIVIQSRELNIENYLEYLRLQEKQQTNKLLKIQTADYIEYIQELISLGKIMNKRFYAIVPYDPLTDKHRGFWSLFKEAIWPATNIKLKEKIFSRYKQLLNRRLESVIGGLESMGMSAVALDTQSLIELYYRTNNPETARNQDLVDVNKLRVGGEQTA